MKRDRFESAGRKRRGGFGGKAVVLVLALSLLVGGAIGGTLAWLTDKTDEIKNVFTIGNINIELTETEQEYKMVPGTTIAKDPTVTVEADSENCYLFVKLEKSDNFDDFLTYDMADGWTELDGEAGVYYREVESSDNALEFSVLAGDKVSVKANVTKAMMDGLTEETYPTLTVTAYACQSEGMADAAAAWNAIQADLGDTI